MHGPDAKFQGRPHAMNRIDHIPSARPGTPYPGEANVPAYGSASTLRDGIDLVGMFESVRKRIRVALGILLAVSILGIGFTLAQTPKYTSTALLMIDPAPERLVDVNQTINRAAPDEVIVESEIEILKSVEMAARLAAAMDLENDPEFNWRLREPSPVQSTFGAIGRFFGSIFSGGGQAEAALAAGDPGVAQLMVPDDVAYAVGEAITVRRRGLSFGIEVSVTTDNPAKSARMANEFANTYLTSRLEDRFASVGTAGAWIEERLAELRAEVLEKEADVQRFRAQKGLLTAEGVSLTEQQIADVQSSVIAARAEYAEAQARYSQLNELIRSGSSADSIAGVLNSPVIRDLRVQEAAIAQQQADFDRRYGDQHPEVRRIRSERADVQQQIKAEIDRIASSMRNEVMVVGSRLRSLESDLEQNRRALVSNNEELVTLGELESEARAARSVYDSFLQRSHQVEHQGTFAKVDATLASPARPVVIPSSPKVLFSSVLSIGAGGVLALLFVAVAERFRHTFRSPEEAESKIGLRSLAVVPRLDANTLRSLPAIWRNPPKYLVENPISPFGEAIRDLRTSLVLAVPPRSSPVIAITSAAPNEGKSSISLSLARLCALSGKRTVIIDCDTRRRAMNRLLRIEPEQGLLEVLNGTAELADVIGADEDTGAHVIPVASESSQTQDLFSSGDFQALLDQLSDEYDFIILDCAPVLAVAETRQVAKMSDVCVLVARCNETHSGAVRAAAESLQMAGAPLIGMVLNFFDARVPGGFSGYGSAYYWHPGNSYYNQPK